MPRFRASYVDRDGAPRVEWIDGPTARWAVLHFEHAGARQVSVLEDPLAPDGRDFKREAAFLEERATRAKARTSAVEPSTLADFIDDRLAQPAPKRALTPGVAALGWLWPAGFFALMAWLQRPQPSEPATFNFKLMCMMAGASIALGVLRVSPMWLDFRMRHARAWHDWPTLLRLSAIAGWHPIIRSMPALRYGVGTLRAAALAGTGRLDEALALVERVAKENRQPQSFIDNARAGVYLAANRFDDGIAMRRRAAEDPARPFMRVDLAVALLEYRGDVDGAREQLAKVDAPPTSLLEAAFRSLAFGLLDIEEGRPADAVAALTRARNAFQREAAAPSIEGIFLWTDPFLCLALAQSNERERAMTMLPRVMRYLEASSRPAWLHRCRDALGEAEASGGYRDRQPRGGA